MTGMQIITFKCISFCILAPKTSLLYGNIYVCIYIFFLNLNTDRLTVSNKFWYKTKVSQQNTKNTKNCFKWWFYLFTRKIIFHSSLALKKGFPSLLNSRLLGKCFVNWRDTSGRCVSQHIWTKTNKIFQGKVIPTVKEGSDSIFAAGLWCCIM